MVDQEQDFQADMACALSKEGYSLPKIAQLLMVEPDTVLNLIAKKTRLSKHEVQMIFNSMKAGLSIKDIPSIPAYALKLFLPETSQTGMSRDYKAEIRRCFGKGLPFHQIEDYLGVSMIEILKVLDDDEDSVARRREAEERIEPPKKIVEEAPQYIYSYQKGSSSLLWTTLSTGETREEILRNHTFRSGSVWCEVAGGDIYFTGGRDGIFHPVNEVVRVSGSSQKVTQKAVMLRERMYHGGVYYKDYLYAIGGWNGDPIRQCERLLVSEDRWEALQPLPQPCCDVSVVVVKGTECLFALGGDEGINLDVIQRLSLGRLEWDVMPLRLPTSAYSIACFSKESKVWFVVGEKLYCLNALAESSITLIKQVEEINSRCGPSYYHRGYLYCSNDEGVAQRIEIGQLCVCKKKVGELTL